MGSAMVMILFTESGTRTSTASQTPAPDQSGASVMVVVMAKKYVTI